MGVRPFLIFALLLSQRAFGFGYFCRSTDGYLVTLEHHLKGGKRYPEQLTVAQRTQGILLQVGEEDIIRTLYEGYVEYATDGNGRVDANVVAVQIQLHEGREFLLPGETTTGNLILYGHSRRRIRLNCFRFDRDEWYLR